MTKFNFFKPKGDKDAIPATPTNVNNNIMALLEILGFDIDTYSNTATYEIDDLVVYENIPYYCTTAITEPEEFNPEHWEVFSIFNFVEVADLNPVLKKLIHRETILFKSAEGSNENINFSESPFNFKRLLIEFTDTVNYRTAEIIVEEDKTFTLSMENPDKVGQLYIYTTRYILTEKGINVVDKSYNTTTISNSKDIFIANANSIRITKVIAFEY